MDYETLRLKYKDTVDKSYYNPMHKLKSRTDEVILNIIETRNDIMRFYKILEDNPKDRPKDVDERPYKALKFLDKQLKELNRSIIMCKLKTIYAKKGKYT